LFLFEKYAVKYGRIAIDRGSGTKKGTHKPE
jgi:hypothetical protein